MASKNSTLNKKNISFVILLLLICAAYSIYAMSLGKNYPVQGAKQLVSVNQGDTYAALIDRMSIEKKIYFPWVVKAYRKFMIHGTLKAGVYELKRGMTVREVLDMMSNAENAQMNTVMIIDGTTSKQLLQRLKKDPFVKKTVVDLHQDQMMKTLGIDYSNLEGLLAPNTYFYGKGESDQKIILDLYRRQMDILDRAWEHRAPNLPYKNKYEALIMASIIEKETSVDRELRQVSGVFVRRLQQGMRLQTDPTVIYGMGDNYKGRITKQDLRTPTPYNTYTMTGLPPTPIALPSKNSIEAAMHPDQSENIYFVATGNGGHTFSATLDAHNQAVQQYLAVLRAKKVGQ